MKKIMVLVLGTFISLGVFAKDDDCDMNVDMADSLDFHKMHVDCADDPVTIYDPESTGSFLSGKPKAVTTYAEPEKVAAEELTSEQATQSAAKPVSGNIKEEVAQQDNSGVVFNIREPFTLTGGPHSAINGLFVQMGSYCPQGWTKDKEWVEPSTTGYFLHYQFQCAE